ncbi:HlyD family type I secretion periplasmic adaptor subunit [Magnetococcales bacterium HHB-1]
MSRSDQNTDIEKAKKPSNLDSKRSKRTIRFLAQSVMLEESGNPLLVQMLVVSVCFVVIAFLLWASITRVDEVAVTQGIVAPTGQVQVVQHLEGGIVTDILVKEGDLVEQGQTLLRLDDVELTSQLAETAYTIANHRLQIERLEAFIHKRDPLFPKVDKKYDILVQNQKDALIKQKQARQEQIHILQSRIRQKEADLILLNDDERTTRQQLNSLREELRLRKALTREGLSSKIQLLSLQRDVSLTEGSLKQIFTRRKQTQENLQENKKSLHELDARLSHQAVTKLNDLKTELAQSLESQTRLKERHNRLAIKAKVRGVVQSLKVNSPGGVILPGAILLELVPKGRELIVETKITTRDIGHVKIGQTVIVKVMAYDFARYGGVDGILRQISPTTFLNEQQEPYYKGIVILKRHWVGPEHEENLRPILPGMTVQADIKTGNKTIMEYLLKPIYTSASQALQER